jgi:hypothetical protein
MPAHGLVRESVHLQDHVHLVLVWLDQAALAERSSPLRLSFRCGASYLKPSVMVHHKRTSRFSTIVWWVSCSCTAMLAC